MENTAADGQSTSPWFSVFSVVKASRRSNPRDAKALCSNRWYQDLMIDT
jgi:hypothetical protein